MMKLVLGITVAVFVALGAGWFWGRSGRAELDRALEVAELQKTLLEGRGAVLDGRLAIYNINFGEASTHFEKARVALRAADARLKTLDRPEDSKQVALALTRIDEAQRKSGEMSQDANALASDAAKAIEGVLGKIALR